MISDRCTSFSRALLEAAVASAGLASICGHIRVAVLDTFGEGPVDAVLVGLQALLTELRLADGLENTGPAYVRVTTAGPG